MLNENHATHPALWNSLLCSITEFFLHFSMIYGLNHTLKVVAIYFVATLCHCSRQLSYIWYSCTQQSGLLQRERWPFLERCSPEHSKSVYYNMFKIRVMQVQFIAIKSEKYKYLDQYTVLNNQVLWSSSNY